MALRAADLSPGQTHEALVVDNLSRTQIVQYRCQPGGDGIASIRRSVEDHQPPFIVGVAEYREHQ